MAKVESNKEAGVEKAPVLTEDKGVEITPEMVAELQAKNAELEDNNTLMGNEIETQKEAITLQGDTLKEQSKKIEILLKENTHLKDSIEEKEGIIEEQKSKIAQLNKSIVDFGTIYSKGNEVESSKEEEVSIRFLLSPAGRFKLPYNVGQEVALHKEVAAEIVEAMYAEYVE